MYVESVWLNTAPFTKYRIDFSPKVNIIRGRNGAGKTTVLESLALFGHLPVLCLSPQLYSRSVMEDHSAMRTIVTVRLNPCDVAFLKRCLADAGLPRPMKEYAEDMRDRALQVSSGRFWRPENLQKVRERLAELSERADLESHSFTVGIAESSKWTEKDKRLDMKVSLTSEQLLKEDWVCAAEDEADFYVLGLLLSASRPEELGDDSAHTRCGFVPPLLRDDATPARKWHKTLRAQILDEWHESESAMKPSERMLANDVPLPGIVSYVNTDMYEFGVGLDVRESPKELGEAFTLVLAQRLQLLRQEPPLDATAADVYVLRSFSEIKNAWAKVFALTPGDAAANDDPGQADDGSEPLTDCFMTSNREKQVLWTVKVGADERSFFSSGENQTFFLLAVTCALRPVGSCLLIDEPELHLSLGVASKLFDHLFDFSCVHGSQVIAVTHVPFLFNSRQSLERRTPDCGHPEWADARIILVDPVRNPSGPIVGLPAIWKQSAQHAFNMDELFRDLQLEDKDVAFWPMVGARLKGLLPERRPPAGTSVPKAAGKGEEQGP